MMTCQNALGALLAASVLLLLVQPSCAAQAQSQPDRRPAPCPTDRSHSRAGANARDPEIEPSLKLLGVSSPATVSGAVLVAIDGAMAQGTLTFCLDGAPLRLSTANAAQRAEEPVVLSLESVRPGEHLLHATARAADGRPLQSDQVLLHVVPTANDQFSSALTPYALQPSVVQPLSELLTHIETPRAALTTEEAETRTQVAAMYQNFGFDLSLDAPSDQSDILVRLLPSKWAPPVPGRHVPLSQQFSPDAPFYKAIPTEWPRVQLPKGYLSTIQLNTNQGGDGIGYGVAIADDHAPVTRITSQWYEQVATRRVVEIRAPADWSHFLPRLAAGDRHVIFVDPSTESFVSAYKTRVDAQTSEPAALYASPVTSFNSLGDHGGSTAAGFAELPLLLWPGEATAEEAEIHHALGGPVSRTWAARIYPATSRDAGMLTSLNSCPGKGSLLTNTGLIPYGGIIQLDPSLDLTRLGLSRPAQRILRAIQVYGYYVMDFGCADLDIYTAVDEKEFMPFGGVYGWNAQHRGVQAEIADVLTTQKLYVVPPLVKRP